MTYSIPGNASAASGCFRTIARTRAMLPASRLVSSAPLFPVAPVIRIIVQSPFADMYFDTRDVFAAQFVLREVVAKQRRALIVYGDGDVCFRRRHLVEVIVREFPRSCEWGHLDRSLQCRPRAAD